MEKKPKVFVCYAHEDEALKQGLEKQLRVLRRQGLIDIWHDRNISAGTEWEREIDIHLNTAQIILLLISPNFIDSDYCFCIEMKRAMERHHQGSAHVIPIILRPVYWQGGPFNKLQVLPTNAIPVTGRKWHNQDEAFYDIAEGIRSVIEGLSISSLKQVQSGVELLPLLSISATTHSISQEKASEWIDVGNTLTDLDQFQEALIAYEQATLLDPSNAVAYINMGNALNRLDRYEEGLVACEQAIQLNPSNAHAYINKAYAFNGLNQYAEALNCCEQAIQLDPTLIHIYVNKSRALLGLCRYTEALATCKSALQLDPDDSDTYYLKSEILTKLGESRKALQAHVKAKRLGHSK